MPQRINFLRAEIRLLERAKNAHLITPTGLRQLDQYRTQLSILRSQE